MNKIELILSMIDGCFTVPPPPPALAKRNNNFSNDSLIFAYNFVTLHVQTFAISVINIWLLHKTFCVCGVVCGWVCEKSEINQFII